MTINYVDLCADLFHCEHVAGLKIMRELGGTVYAGIHSDETIMSYKRHPVMTMEERIIVVEACRYVDKVIPDAPLEITEEFLLKHKIDMVITQERPDHDLELMYHVPIKRNMLKILPQWPRIVSTGRIIKRVIDLHSRGLLERQPSV